MVRQPYQPVEIDPLRKTYPLQLTGFHYKARTHSSYGNIDVLQQACPQEVWIDHGPQMTAIRDGVRGKDKLDVPIKFIWNYAGNTLVNQHSDINKTHEILQDESKCEMIVVIENFMTSSAKYADILLPDLMTVEQEDIIPNDYAGNMGYLIFLQPVTSEKFERKPIDPAMNQES